MTEPIIREHAAMSEKSRGGEGKVGAKTPKDRKRKKRLE
jgi:hypothetical protein